MSKRKPKPPLSEAQAWRVLEIIFDRRAGLCAAIEELVDAGLISPSVYHAMDNAVQTERVQSDRRQHAYLWSTEKFVTEDGPRFAFALAQRRQLEKKRGKK